MTDRQRARWLGRLRTGLDFLLPPGCVVCGQGSGPRDPSTGEARMLCPGCSSRIRRPPAPWCERCHAPLGTGTVSEKDHCRECEGWPDALHRARSAAILRPPVDDLVHALKYGGWPEAARPMARAMRWVLPDVSGQGTPLLVPVPTTVKRRRLRGFNQARVLAEHLAAMTGFSLTDALVRADGGGSQVALHRDARRANVEGAFSVHERLATTLSGRPVLLVDDVLTTGATASAVAEVLDEVGAGPIRLLVFARTLPGRSADPLEGSGLPPGFFDAINRRPHTDGPESGDRATGRSG